MVNALHVRVSCIGSATALLFVKCSSFCQSVKFTYDFDRLCCESNSLAARLLSCSCSDVQACTWTRSPAESQRCADGQSSFLSTDRCTGWPGSLAHCVKPCLRCEKCRCAWREAGQRGARRRQGRQRRSQRARCFAANSEPLCKCQLNDDDEGGDKKVAEDGSGQGVGAGGPAKEVSLWDVLLALLTRLTRRNRRMR